MTILVTGATGMVGSVLCKRLQTLDIPHLKLSRHPSHSSEDQVFWDPHERILETEKLREVETVIHLAGEPVGKRWTHEIKKKVEKNMEYPGQIKITVIREVRSVEYAK
jgi:NAD dependent epimerase/dehydratase family enzyme